MLLTLHKMYYFVRFTNSVKKMPVRRNVKKYRKCATCHLVLLTPGSVISDCSRPVARGRTLATSLEKLSSTILQLNCEPALAGTVSCVGISFPDCRAAPSLNSELWSLLSNTTSSKWSMSIT